MGARMRQSLYDYGRLYQPQLLDEWDTERNLPLTPQTVTHGSHASVWWRCECGHSWQASVYTRTGGARCPYCTGRKVLPGFNDLASRYPALAKQWDERKNAPLTPSAISAGSQKPVWWRCDKGHSWRAMVRSRVSGCGCPICAGKLVVAGENDLASQFPALAKEWDAEKNGSLTPSQVTAGTGRKVWWRCGAGHSWQAAVAVRTISNTGCPVCAGKQVLPGFNDLASQFPALAKEWDRAKNGALTPDAVSVCSNRKVWWRCKKGHSYISQVASRTVHDSGCPYCTNRKVLAGFNDLASVEPRIAAQWHPTLNGALTAQMVTAGSHRTVWWQCPLGHVWKARIYSRSGAQQCGCPVCAGNARTERRHLSAPTRALPDRPRV